jgi:hypothetical protein
MRENISNAAGGVLADKDPADIRLLSVAVPGVQDQIPVALAGNETQEGYFGDKPARS